MVAIKNVLLFVAASSAWTIGRRASSASTIISDIQTIQADVNQLTKDANAYQSGLSQALPIQNDEQALDKAINQATKDTQASAQLSSADSKNVLAAINKLIPDIQTSLKAIENKTSNFKADGLTKTVHDDLVTLKNDTDTFAAALIKIASSDTKSQGQSDQKQIDGYFTTAINDFSS